MRQLTALDQQFLALEDSRNYGHVGSLGILDPSTAPGGSLSLINIQEHISERLPLVPPFRWRLQEVPLNLDYGYWIEDPDFDLEFHVRELALAPPGTDAQLAEQVARIFSRPLDRSRPLWELYLIYGLPRGRVGVMTKIHHAVIDGISGAEILGALLDFSPEGREAPPTLPAPPEAPGQLGMLARGLLGLPRYPLRLLSSVPRALPNVEEVPTIATIPGIKTAGRIVATAERAIGRRRVVGHLNLTPPHTSFNGRVSAHRRFAFGHLSLDDVKAIKNAHGCTVNDVVVSICAGTVRRWLMEHRELPRRPLVAQIPVSVRKEDQLGTFGNRILLMTAPLYSNVKDPVKRLRLTHRALAQMKERHRALPADLLQDANQFIPPALFSRAARLTFSLSASRRAHPAWNLVVSNVPGPQVPLYMAGARLEAQYPISVVTDGMGLNITVMSYLGALDFGIVADREQMPDVWSLIEWLGEALEELRPAARPTRARTAAAAATAPVKAGKRA
ncbi:MAG: wax ester/triacylglycerol synthase family O-acyltransferase [Solirubrobacterales bacterium]|nr:wax ester/triacylglycerol synthase family O-acyltransferase [Solirubrobacterales bacterium]MBV9714215.1 wax ester/triacylglycerol synthase family O-acyltransferase [Solirubrobacterales bacterium]